MRARVGKNKGGKAAKTTKTPLPPAPRRIPVPPAPVRRVTPPRRQPKGR